MSDPSRARAASIAALVASVGVVLGRFLFDGSGMIPSHSGGDTAGYLAAARAFTAEELLRGNLPLWNPHVFSGTPYVGIFQSSALYPANALYLVLPLSTAITLELALHLILLGVTTFLWLRVMRLETPGAAFAALAVCLGAGTMMRVLAGQLTVLDTQAWTPLLLASVHQSCRRPSLGWTLTGVFAVGMMILAGHPPTLLMAGFVTVLYAALQWIESGHRTRAAGVLLFIPAAAILVGGAQLFTGLAAASEGVRSEGLSYAFATSYSLPPEGLLTLLAPAAFARVDGSDLAYWGRWFYWDTNVYVGLVALLLGIHGAWTTRTPVRRNAAVLTALLGVLALGRYTPLYSLLYTAVPGFASIRAPSKLAIFAAMMWAPLVAAGANAVLDSGRRTRITASLAFTLAAGLGAVALWALFSDPAHAGNTPMEWLARPNPSFDPSPQRLAWWRESLVAGLGRSTLICFGAGALLVLRDRGHRWAAVALLAVGAFDLLTFAYANRGGTVPQPRVEHARALTAAYRQAWPDRVLELGYGTNAALTLRGHGAWGYDPIVLDRYARWMMRTQGWSPDQIERVLSQPIRRDHPALRMLRVRRQVSREGLVIETPGALPHLLLVGEYQRVDGAEAALDAVMAPGFDPWREVILEADPVPAPRPSHDPGTARVVESSTDWLVVEADLSSPSLLLITDVYAKGWRARALDGSDPRDYALLPANGVLRAVPLSAGRHRLIIEYAPVAFTVGAWTSIGATTLLLGATAWWGVASRRAGAPGVSSGSRPPGG